MGHILTITSCLSKKSTLAQANIKNGKRILETLSQLLTEQTPENNDHVLRALVQREKLGSTALGKGIAIPHGRCDQIESVHVAVLTLNQAIDFQAPDLRPVDLFVGMAIPKDNPDDHLALLSGLTRLLSDKNFCNDLRACQSNLELYKAMLMASVHHDSQ